MTRIDALGGLIATWGVARLLGGRASLSARDFARLFVLGATLSSVAVYAGGRLVLEFTDHTRLVSIYAAPVEELGKTLPLLVLLFWARAWRRLSVADWALAGVAGAAGYSFVQWWLDAIAPGGGTAAWHWYLLGSRAQTFEWTGPAFFAGAATTGLVGLLVGIGIALGRRRAWGLGLGAIALLAAMIDNGVFRYRTGPYLDFATTSPPKPAGWLDAINAALLHGRLEIWLLAGGLVLASWIEGRWALAQLPDPRRVLLADEPTAPLVVSEWIVAVRRAGGGWGAFANVNRYFRVRRRYMLAFAALARDPASARLRADTAELRERLIAARRFLDDHAGPRYPMPEARWATVSAFGVAALLFAAAPSAWPSGAHDVLTSGKVAFLIALLALAGAVYRLRSAPTPEGGAGLVLAVCALVTLTMSTSTLVPDYTSTATHFEPVERWVAGTGYPDYGGSPQMLLALLALLAVTAVPAAARPRREKAPAAVGVPGAG